MKRKAPDVVVRRLALYLRILDEIGTDAGEPEPIPSFELGRRAGVSAAQVRKDLSLFGEFGKQGVGYDARFLRDQLRRVLKLDRVVNIGMAGAGALGVALGRYSIRRHMTQPSYPFRLAALFDVDPAKVGVKVGQARVYHLDQLPEKVKEMEIRMMIIAVPADAAQKVADMCGMAGVKAILNFAPAKLTPPPGVRLHSADLTMELQHLAYYL